MNGELSVQNFPLVPSRFIYIEGPIWLQLAHTIHSDFIVLMNPVSIESWEKAYIFRNIHFRNYTIEDAKKAFDLALFGWKRVMAEHDITPNIKVEIDFIGPTFIPKYKLL